MEELLTAIKNSPLFHGLPNVEDLLKCLTPVKKPVACGAVIFGETDAPAAVGLVLSGAVHIVKTDYWGHTSIIAEISAGDMFGEALACAGADEFPVSVVAASDANILLINYRRIITTCTSACAFHTALIANMLKILAKKNVMLMSKMAHLTKRTIRDKLLSYLSEQAKRYGSDSFAIPFNRQQLADFLSVERSALSAEMSKMRGKGLIEYRKNRFVIACSTFVK
jgi:CRP-like cAMP-binding protein